LAEKNRCVRVTYGVKHDAIVKVRHEHQIVMGYGGLTIESIRQGVRRLRQALEEANPHARLFTDETVP
jgi:DNA-binding transcriptional MocR family regulator